MICPKRDCEEGESCPHYLEHEEDFDNAVNAHCAFADNTCPSCVEELSIYEFITEKDMEI